MCVGGRGVTSIVTVFFGAFPIRLRETNAPGSKEASICTRCPHCVGEAVSQKEMVTYSWSHSKPPASLLGSISQLGPWPPVEGCAVPTCQAQLRS